MSITCNIGNLTLTMVDDHQKQFYESDNGKLLSELEKILPPEIFAERKVQLMFSDRLAGLYDGAAAVLQLRKDFKVTGDFSSYEAIVNSVSHDT